MKKTQHTLNNILNGSKDDRMIISTTYHQLIATYQFRVRQSSGQGIFADIT